MPVRREQIELLLPLAAGLLVTPVGWPYRFATMIDDNFEATTAVDKGVAGFG